uniref:AAA+ ATPase domain-containing protein n=1 Tax=Leersia perrieri TaxID=77586 RepID=A0A0D9W372_9ORYZ
MAESVLFVTLSKITAALGADVLQQIQNLLPRESSLFVQLSGCMNRIKKELSVIQAFLSQADLQSAHTRTIEAWVDAVRKVALDVEDIIDEYVHLLGQQKGGRFTSVKVNFGRSQRLSLWHQIVERLEEIERDLQHISEMKERWAQTSTELLGADHQCALPYSPQCGYFINSDDMIGFGKYKMMLMNWLARKDSSTSVMVIFGMGGIGKTTLASNVYESEKSRYDCSSWIATSQVYNTSSLLRMTIRDCFKNMKEIPQNIDMMDLHSLIVELREFLKGRSCLVVIDDVWDQVSVDPILKAFCHSEHRNKVIITTREIQVAKFVDQSYMLQMEELEETEAWDLFCRKAFLNEEERSCPEELVSIAKDIMKWCCGLPLALVTMGGLLSLREKNNSEWKRVYDKLLCSFENDPGLNHLKHVINLSYRYLPEYLKNCFLFCSIFPENSMIKRKHLIRLWIAEGFVENRGRTTMEELAHHYLSELIHRGMLQVMKRNDNGRVKHCRMHCIVREVTISLCKSRGFHMIWGNDESTCTYEARRFAMHEITQSSSEILIDLPHVRTFLSFDVTMTDTLLSRIICSSRYLTVCIRALFINEVPKEVVSLFNLRYLGLRRTKVKKLPSSLEKLANLQTLDLHHSCISKLPSGITKLENLRHLFVETVKDSSFQSLNACSGVGAPSGICRLKSLQTLFTVEASKGFVKQANKLVQLKSFRITKVKGSHCPALSVSVKRMNQLVYLDIVASDEKEVLNLDISPPPRTLEKLCLRGKLDNYNLHSFFNNFGNNLTCLFLGWSGLSRDPLPLLSDMTNLAFLWLQRAFDGAQLRFVQGWFPRLRRLHLKDMEHLNSLEIEKGSVVSLEVLEMTGLNELKEIPGGILLLNNLQEVYLDLVHKEYFPNHEREDENADDVPRIIYSHRPNFWRGEIVPKRP